MLDLTREIFIIHITFLSLESKMLIHPAQKAWIVLLIAKKIIIPNKYLDYAKNFLKKLAIELSKYFDINKYIIHLDSGK